VAHVAQAEGVSANQVFQWQRAYRNGELQAGGSTALLPVVIGVEAATVGEIKPVPEIAPAAPTKACSVQPSGAIHIELPGRAAISMERNADRALLRMDIESLRL
jgi:transposase-like protein